MLLPHVFSVHDAAKEVAMVARKPNDRMKRKKKYIVYSQLEIKYANS